MEEKNVIQQDWYDREFVTAVHFGMTKIVSFLNRFEAEARFKLARVNEQLTRVERNCDFVEAILRKLKPEKIKRIGVEGTIFDPDWRKKELERKRNGVTPARPILKKIYTKKMTGIIKAGPSMRSETKEVEFAPPITGNNEEKAPVVKQEIVESKQEQNEQKSPVDTKTKIPIPKPAVNRTSDAQDGKVPESVPPAVPGDGPKIEVPDAPITSKLPPPGPGSVPPPGPDIGSHPPSGPPPGPPVLPAEPPVVPGIPPASPVEVSSPGAPPPLPTTAMNVPGPPPMNKPPGAPIQLPPPGPGQPPPKPISFSPPGPPMKPPSQIFDGPPVFEDTKRSEDDDKNSEDEEEESSYEDPPIKEFQPKIPDDHNDIWIQRVKPGDANKPGPTPNSGLVIEYTGWIKNTGDCFDQIDDFPFQMGSGDNIVGLERILLKMKEGENILAFIPSHLAYGVDGGGDVIPPNSDLVFDLTLRTIE